MISSRKNILEKIKQNQPAYLSLPLLDFEMRQESLVVEFIESVKKTGGVAYYIKSNNDIYTNIQKTFNLNKRIVSTCTGYEKIAQIVNEQDKPHQLEDVHVAIIKSTLGVSENGALWVTEENIKIRVLPFICEHLILIVDKTTIVDNMHQAYEQIDGSLYDYGTFIAGPSKTADIEQSLVMGAHGPKTLTVFIQ